MSLSKYNFTGLERENWREAEHDAHTHTFGCDCYFTQTFLSLHLVKSTASQRILKSLHQGSLAAAH